MFDDPFDRGRPLLASIAPLQTLLDEFGPKFSKIDWVSSILVGWMTQCLLALARVMEVHSFGERGWMRRYIVAHGGWIRR